MGLDGEKAQLFMLAKSGISIADSVRFETVKYDKIRPCLACLEQVLKGCVEYSWHGRRGTPQMCLHSTSFREQHNRSSRC